MYLAAMRTIKAMLKLYCVTETRPRLGDPVIKGHQTGEMILYEAKDFLHLMLLDSKRRLHYCPLLWKTSIESTRLGNQLKNIGKR